MIVSIAIIGCAFGSIIGGPIADKFGRKKVIYLADAFFTAGSIVMFMSMSITELVVGRFIVGVFNYF